MSRKQLNIIRLKQNTWTYSLQFHLELGLLYSIGCSLYKCNIFESVYCYLAFPPFIIFLFCFSMVFAFNALKIDPGSDLPNTFSRKWSGYCGNWFYNRKIFCTTKINLSPRNAKLDVNASFYDYLISIFALKGNAACRASLIFLAKALLKTWVL